MNHKLLITSFLWIVLTVIQSIAQTAASVEAVDTAVEQLAQRPGMDAASLGVAVLRLGPDSEIVVDVNGKRSLIPASTIKILTSVTALDLLGPETIFETVAKHGITTTGLALHDGSGLSHSNLITPRQMVHVLSAADEGPHSRIFRRSLPVAGKSGTLANVGRGTSAAGRIHAKSGTLERV